MISLSWQNFTPIADIEGNSKIEKYSCQFGKLQSSFKETFTIIYLLTEYKKAYILNNFNELWKIIIACIVIRITMNELERQTLSIILVKVNALI